MRYHPSVLIVSGERPGLLLPRGLVWRDNIVQAVAAFNREVGPEQRIRLLVNNSCMSGPLAEQLSESIDFVIGHGHSEVGDAQAIIFAKALFKLLGKGLSLDASFKAARMTSNPFRLYARRYSPASFFLYDQGLQSIAQVSLERLLRAAREYICVHMHINMSTHMHISM